MTWVRIDDHFDEHPKLAEAGVVCWGVWLAGIAYCNRNLTDGFIPWTVARTIGSWEVLDTEEEDGKHRVWDIGRACGMSGEDMDTAWIVDRLVAIGLWDQVPGGYRIHDYSDYQPTKAEVISRRDQKAEAGRVGGLATQAQRKAPAKADGKAPASAPAKAQSKPVPKPKPVPVPDSVSEPKGLLTREGLPSEDDSATAACRMFVNGGRWLDDDEYVGAWDDLDRRFTREWVKAEITPAYAELHAVNAKVKPWDLMRKVEFLCAERARTEDRAKEAHDLEERLAESRALREKAEAATDEDRRRAEIIRKAIKLWLKRRPSEPVPTDFDELSAWLAEVEPLRPKAETA